MQFSCSSCSRGGKQRTRSTIHHLLGECGHSAVNRRQGAAGACWQPPHHLTYVCQRRPQLIHQSCPALCQSSGHALKSLQGSHLVRHLPRPKSGLHLPRLLPLCPRQQWCAAVSAQRCGKQSCEAVNTGAEEVLPSAAATEQQCSWSSMAAGGLTFRSLAARRCRVFSRSRRSSSCRRSTFALWSASDVVTCVQAGRQGQVSRVALLTRILQHTLQQPWAHSAARNNEAACGREGRTECSRPIKGCPVCAAPALWSNRHKKRCHASIIAVACRSGLMRQPQQ
jgi:hypothetical protein